MRTHVIKSDIRKARSLREATRGLLLAHGALDDARRPCGTPLPAPHAYALIELLGCPMTVSTLAQRLSIDRTNVSRLCARMEALGELRRTPHPEDRRAVLVRLTAKGTRTARAVEASSTAHFERVLANLGDDAQPIVQALLCLTNAMHKTALETSS